MNVLGEKHDKAIRASCCYRICKPTVRGTVHTSLVSCSYNQLRVSQSVLHSIVFIVLLTITHYNHEWVRTGCFDGILELKKLINCQNQFQHSHFFFIQLGMELWKFNQYTILIIYQAIKDCFLRIHKMKVYPGSNFAY